MKYQVLLICENPDENKRKMWYAEYDPARNAKVRTGWGRIAWGKEKSPNRLLADAKQTLDVEVADEDAALKFLEKKIREKQSKGYQTVLYQHDDLPMTFLCDRPPDEDGKIVMETLFGT